MWDMLYEPLFIGLSILQMILFGAIVLGLYIFYIFVMKRIHHNLLLTFLAQTGAAIIVSYLVSKIFNIHH